MGTLTLYGKPGCHLCHEAREAVKRALLDRELALEEIVSRPIFLAWVRTWR